MGIKLTSNNKKTIAAAVLATLITGTGAYLVGNISGYEAKVLIKSSLPGINTLCNTIVLASATILALLLTLLSISTSSKSKLKDEHYKHVLLIAKIDTVVFVSAMITFQVFNIPITEADNVPGNWYSTIYYITLGVSSILSGALIGVVLMLFNTVKSIINIIGLQKSDHPLVNADDE